MSLRPLPTLALLVPVTLSALLMLACAGPGGATEPGPVRVGVYDSRALAIAWVRAEPFRQYMAERRAAHEKAEEAGDADSVQAIETEMQDMQAKLHRQGFGTEPVPEVLAHLKDHLPDIAAAAGVDLIVCRFDLAYQADDLPLVNVTEEMVRPLKPDEKAWKSIREIQEQDPVPVEELDRHQH